MMPSYDAIQAQVRASHLDIFGAFHPEPDDLAPEGTGTLILLGPHEPGFWAMFTAADEARDGAPDPVDRWSTRVITALADEFGARALFPFGGPPYQPFIRWAIRSGRAWQSPVDILVHDTAGLMVSYRGAIALPGKLDLPSLPAKPCDCCADKPCLTACPPRALTDQGYDVPRCKDYLAHDGKMSCMAGGCLVRRACPVSQSYGRDPAQSAYHMGQFLG